jgi:nitrogen regulatory protein PII
MQMVMVVFRSSLSERVHELLHQCDVNAFTEVNETVGYGQTGPAEGLSFYPGTNSVILVALDDDHVVRVAKAVTAWCEEAEKHPGWQKPSLRVFTWPCSQIV